MELSIGVKYDFGNSIVSKTLFSGIEILSFVRNFILRIPLYDGIFLRKDEGFYEYHI